MTLSGLDAGGDQNFSVAKPFGGGPEIAEFVDGELINAELKRFKGLLLTLLYPFKWPSPRRDMRVKVLARLLLYEGIDIRKEGWIERRPRLGQAQRQLGRRQICGTAQGPQSPSPAVQGFHPTA
jgi:hypothetical protein